MRTILVALAVTIKDDSPTPAGIVEIEDFQDYQMAYVEEAVVVAVADREHPENNVEEHLFTDYAPRSACSQ